MELTIYHTNDIHSSFTGLAQIASYLKQHRRPEDLYFDCGDLCDLKDITVQGTRGKGAIRLMKQAVIHSLDGEFVRQSVKGPVVRGKVLGTLGFSHNVRIKRNPLTIWINGELLDESRTYVCMADDSLQRGTGYTELATADEQAVFFPGFIRNLLERTLNSPDILKTAQVQRIVD